MQLYRSAHAALPSEMESHLHSEGTMLSNSSSTPFTENHTTKFHKEYRMAHTDSTSPYTRNIVSGTMSLRVTTKGINRSINK